MSEADFARVQQISALPVADDGNLDRYQLTGLVIGGRRAERHWAHGRARYRSRHDYTSNGDAQPCHAKTLYVRQDQIVEQPGIQLANLTGTDPAALTAVELAAQLRGRQITIVCTPVSITLDTGEDIGGVVENSDVASPADVEPEPVAPATVTNADLKPSDPAASPPSSVLPRQRAETKNPHQNHPRKVNNFGTG